MEIPKLTLSDTEFRQIREIVWKITGISLADSKKALVISRLARRLKDLECSTFFRYIQRLKTNSDEVLFLVNHITTNLTRFYREKAQFVPLKENILPEILAAAGKKGKHNLRIWSAGCSSGEEVYTILFEILDYFKGTIPATLDLKILGTDIDTNMLKKASSGRYSDEELKGVEEYTVVKYFNRVHGVEGKQFEIKRQFKKYVVFTKLNLVYDDFKFRSKIDAIFCRNVVIYFNKETKEKVYKKFYTALDDPGYFFSGHSENLFQYSHIFKFIGKSVYKKVA